jgi:TRAP-type uncharacterized transport system substrate-binding protein
MLLAMFSLPLLENTIQSAEALNEPQFLKFVTGTIGGGWYTQAGTLAETIKSGLPEGSDVVVVPGGGVSNIATLSLGNADLGHAHSIYAAWAAAGTGPFQENFPNIKGVAALEDNYITIIATKSSGITSLKDVMAKKIPMRLVAMRPISDGGGLIGVYLGAEYGLGKPDLTDSYPDLIASGGRYIITNSHSESIANLIDGKGDVWLAVASNGMAQIIELQATREIVFIPIESEVLKIMQEKYGLPEYTVPAGTFQGMATDYHTIGVQSTISANSNTLDSVVYAALKSLVDNRAALISAFPKLEQFKPESAWKNVGFELHPGALKYYRDMGFIK